MVTGVKKDYGNITYMRIKKHNCPDCGGATFVRKVKKRVKSGSKLAKNFDFSVGDTLLSGTVKFIWYEFKCKYTTGGQMRTKEVPRYSQVGNAIPPLFAELVGLVLKEMI